MGTDFYCFFLLAAFIGDESAHTLVREGFQQHRMGYSAIDNMGAGDTGPYRVEGTADFW